MAAPESAAKTNCETHYSETLNSGSSRSRQDTAIRLARRGLAVFPLKPGAKVPLPGSHGHKDASADPAVAAERWRQHPDANIGIATGAVSGVWVLDIDYQHGGEGSLAELVERHGPLPRTVEASTPSGGRHLYSKWIEGIRNSAGRIGAGLDVRGAGGYAVAPPSVLADGRRYRWRCSGPLADAPAWLVYLAKPPPPPPRLSEPITGNVDRYIEAAVEAELAALANAKPGTRNDQLNRSAFALFGFVKAGALDEEWLRAELARHGHEIGLPDWRIYPTLNSAFVAAQPRRIGR